MQKKSCTTAILHSNVQDCSLQIFAVVVFVFKQHDILEPCWQGSKHLNIKKCSIYGKRLKYIWRM